MPIPWARLVDIVSAGRRFLLTTHMRPDCDGLGSELAMAGILESLGKEVWIVNGDAVPPHLTFIDPGRRILVLGRDVSADALMSFDVVMLLDTSAWAQIGPIADVWRGSAANKVIIDHHVSEDELGGLVIKDPSSDSTGRLVLQAADALHVELAPNVAAPLFAAVATDTGWFRFASVTGETFRAAARLIDAGARPEELYSALYEQTSLARLRLRGRILTRACSHYGGRLMLSRAQAEDFSATGAEASDTEDVVNMLLSVAGSKVAALLQELGNGNVKVSLRCRGDVDVRQVAERFGGGGHMSAAGAQLPGPLETAEATIIDALRGVLE